ncbi:MAG: spondin domain-containing protein [Gammaproteobacteria bacterium]|nr:spondin domain-containing protein [Gammaproteobacteria bacterium]
MKKIILHALVSILLIMVHTNPAMAQSTATYRVNFEAKWTTAVTPGGIPGSAHFTTLIGAVHNSQVSFWRSGETASPGIELMAELGGTSTLSREIEAAGSNAHLTLQARVGGGPTPSNNFEFTTTSNHPLVTLTSMVAPSPDWFIGISALSLQGSNGWLASRTVDLYPWDAGTENGTEFSLSNPPTSPQGVITSLRGSGKFTSQPIATLIFTLLSSTPATPTGLTSMARNGAVTLSWDNPNNGAISKYQYNQRVEDVWQGWTDIPDSGADTVSHTVTGLTNGKEYHFTVRAVAGSAMSDPSPEVMSTPNVDSPITPTLTVFNKGDDITEGDAAMFSLMASPAPSNALSVQISVAEFGSFLASGETGMRTVSVNRSGSAIVSVSTVDDATEEPDGNIEVTLLTGNGYSLADSNVTASVMVSDNDNPGGDDESQLESTTAARSHLFPLFADGGGYRSHLLVTDVVGERGRCELTLIGSGVDAVSFTAEPAIAFTTESATPQAKGVNLNSQGGEIMLTSSGAGELTIGYARLECEELAAAQLLITLETDRSLIAMAHQESVHLARQFSLQPLPQSLGVGLAFANDSIQDNSCILEASDESRSQGRVMLPPGETTFRRLDEILPHPEGTEIGPVSVRCEQPTGLLMLPLGGMAFTALPAIVLPEDGEEALAGTNHEETVIGAINTLLPLVLDGGGFRSRLMAVNLATEVNRCELRLSGIGGLTAANFSEVTLIDADLTEFPSNMDGTGSANGFSFELVLENRGVWAVLESLGGDILTYGHAELNCEGPAIMQNLIVLDGTDSPTAMMTLGPAQPAQQMRFHAPSAPMRLALVAANSGEITACTVSLMASDGTAVPSYGNSMLTIMSQSTVTSFLDEIFVLPNDFAGGTADLVCDHPVGAMAILMADQQVFTAVRPIISGLEAQPKG